MATNPLVDQGSLNRLRGNILVVALPTLNVTAPYLGKEGISMALEGQATLMMETMTGAATSPEPYQQCTLTVHLLKTQNIADRWKKQMETDTRLGDITVYPDSSALSTYPLSNCAIKNVSNLDFNGQTVGYIMSIEGTYFINNDLWNLT